MNPADLRAAIPALEETVYLNTGASGPSPRRVVAAAQSAIERAEYDAPGGQGTYPAAFEVFDETRAAVADHIGADPETVALSQSTTHGIGRVVAAMDWGPGDVIARTDLEHAAGLFPCQRLAETAGVDVRVIETAGGRIDRDSYKRAVADARLVVLSSLTWTHGTRLPVAELVDIAHDAGARVLVDAVQSVGQHRLDISAWDADAVVAAGHKWLLGTWGAGFLTVAPDFVESLTPLIIGYRGVEDPDATTYDLRSNARRFEVGTTAIGPYAALQEGIALFEELGYDTVTSRVERLTDRLKDGLGERVCSPCEYESGLVTFRDGTPERTVAALADAGVQVRSLPLDNTVRASVHVFNTEADIDALLTGLA